MNLWSSPQRFQSSQSSTKEEQVYDVLIVGSGAAGSVLVNRISANTTLSVALIEAGSTDESFPQSLIHDEWFASLADTEHHWRFSSTPQSELKDRVVDLDMAKVRFGVSTTSGLLAILFLRVARSRGS